MRGRTTFVIAHRLSTIRRAEPDPRPRAGPRRRARHARPAPRGEGTLPRDVRPAARRRAGPLPGPGGRGGAPGRRHGRDAGGRRGGSPAGRAAAVAPRRMSDTSPFQDKVVLAPLTVGGNLPFRRLCTEMGADVTVGEMAVVRKLLRGSSAEFALLRSHPVEAFFGVQLADNKPESLAEGARLAESRGARFVDLNCGCPIDQITRQGPRSEPPAQARPPRPSRRGRSRRGRHPGDGEAARGLERVEGERGRGRARLRGERGRRDRDPRPHARAALQQGGRLGPDRPRRRRARRAGDRQRRHPDAVRGPRAPLPHRRALGDARPRRAHQAVALPRDPRGPGVAADARRAARRPRPSRDAPARALRRGRARPAAGDALPAVAPQLPLPLRAAAGGRARRGGARAPAHPVARAGRPAGGSARAPARRRTCRDARALRPGAAGRAVDGRCARAGDGSGGGAARNGAGAVGAPRPEPRSRRARAPRA